MSIDLGEILVSKICSDKKYGTWWAVGAKGQWMELRVTNGGKIRPGIVHKKKHPYFTKEKP